MCLDLSLTVVSRRLDQSWYVSSQKSATSKQFRYVCNLSFGASVLVNMDIRDAVHDIKYLYRTCYV